MNIPEKLLKIIKAMYANPNFYVEVEGEESSTAKQNTGIRQGCPLSPYLFIMVMDRLFDLIPHFAEEKQKKMKLPTKRKPNMNLSFSSLLYADDTLLCEEEEQIMESLLWSIEDISEIFGLNLNEGKCQQISVGKSKNIRFRQLNKVTKVSTAEYLGSLLQEKNKPQTRNHEENQWINIRQEKT